MNVLPRALRDNPIVRAEIMHLQRTGKVRRARGQHIMLVLLFSSGMLLHIAQQHVEAIAAFTQTPGFSTERNLSSLYNFVLIFLCGSLMAQHLTHISQTLNYAAHSVARERQNRTWEGLLLTGIHAERVVWGKWWAAIRTSFVTTRPLLLWRVFIVLFIGMAATEPRLTFGSSVPLPLVITGAALIGIYPLIGGMTSAAIGVIASLFTRTEGGGGRLASLLNLGAIIMTLFALGMGVLSLTPLNVEPEWIAVPTGALITALDGGLTFAVSMFLSNINTLDSAAFQLGIVIGMALHLLITLLLLALATWIARRVGVSAASSVAD